MIAPHERLALSRVGIPGGRHLRRGAGVVRRIAPAPVCAALLCVIGFGRSAASPLALVSANRLPWLAWFNPRSAVGLSILTGLVIFATTLAILHLVERRRWAQSERSLRDQLGRLRGAADRADILVCSERQVLVSWAGAAGEPTFEGDPTLAGEGANVRRVLAFGAWLVPADAGRLEAALVQLRTRGEVFQVTVRTAAGAFIDAEGRTVGGRALLRLRDISGERALRIQAEQQAAETRGALSGLRGLLDSIAEPVWLRGEDGRLTWANRAFCKAVEGADADEVTARSLELLDRNDRDRAERRRASGQAFDARVAAIVTGSRHVLDITEIPVTGGAAGLARDVSELEAVRLDLQRQRQAHVRTLDQLPMAVAMFDADQRLVFHNAAYRQLWGLDKAYLDTRPSDGEILDALRSAGRLPEQADFRIWKASLLEVYRASDSQETWWHLPDRRSLRVVTNPNPQGGLTYLFDDVSERIHLESRFNALITVQRETLDTLSEGVALFGTDGRLKLFNRAFVDLWRLDRDSLGRELHVDAVIALCRTLAPAEDMWADLRGAVSGLSDMRMRAATRMARVDGSVVEAVAEPLPDGGTLLTFVDVTASVNVERALTERNDALELAGRLRNEFVHHVSYELRSPLTNIIGFTELLGAETVGPLNERQREYANHITHSSGALLAIINDILDLASIDADAIDLVREPVDIVGTIEEAAKGLNDRLIEASLSLVIDAAPDIGSFVADGKRVRQILFNLLSNAAGFSLAGQTIRVTARREGGDVVLAVADQGRGIPQEVKDRVFNRFESHALGTRHRGVGLGLSIVRSLVELHGGRVELDSAPGQGTTVTCFFPADGKPPQRMAAE